MSKVIRLTPELIEEMRQDFHKATEKPDTKIADGKFTFTKNFNNTSEKATVYFTMEAWTKMFMIIRQFDKEVAWHGVCERHDSDGKHGYLIKDILVYPQTVTGTTVEMDTEEYAKWVQANLEDPRFEQIHMQGHSHVRMGVTPSGTDINHQKEILEYLEGDGYYIFMIYNKDLKSNYKIYDYGKNIMFEDTDIGVSFAEGVVGLDEFMTDAKAQVKTRSYSTANSSYSTNSYPKTGTGYQSPNSYDPVKNSTTNKPAATTPATTPAATPAVPATTKPASTTPTVPTVEDKPKTKIGAGWMGKNACQQQSLYGPDDQDDDGIYGGYGGGYGSGYPYYD